MDNETNEIIPETKETCAAGVNDNFSENEIIVVMKPTRTAARAMYSSETFEQVDILEIEDLTSKSAGPADSRALEENSNSNKIFNLTVKSDSKEDLLEKVRLIEENENVLYAQPNFYYDLAVETAQSEAPQPLAGDPLTQWALTDISAQPAWSKYTNDARSVRVGAIDTGIASHPDLNANVIQGYDFYNNNSITTDDTAGHGTHVAGIIAAVGNNGIGISGVAQLASLASLQGANPQNTFSSAVVVKAINYAIQNNIFIINYSVGGYPSMDRAIYSAIRNFNGLFVWAAGNDGVNVDSIFSAPSNYNNSNIISVANIDSADNLSSSSNYGARRVDIAAPGTDIISSFPVNAYIYSGGTSMAAPHVTGAAALIKAYFPDASATQIKKSLISSADTVSSLRGKVLANGKLNVYAALEYYRNNYYDGGNEGDFLEGDGTGANPYMIASASDFMRIREKPSSYYKLKNDIDFKGVNDYSFPSSFGGTLDGDGKSLLNLNFSIDQVFVNAGLFGEISNNGTVKNLSVKNFKFNFSHFLFAGIIAGTCKGLIENVNILNSSIICVNNVYAGGIVGGLEGGVVINAASDSTVSSDGYAGGLFGSASLSASINNCLFTGNAATVSADRMAGGICGILTPSIDMTQTFAYGKTKGIGGGIAGIFNAAGETLQGNYSDVYWDIAATGQAAAGYLVNPNMLTPGIMGITLPSNISAISVD